MPIQNDQRLYSGGDVLLNQQPHIQLYANLMARKQARDDAYEEYIRNLNKGINGAGVRNQDRPAFDQKLADWQKFGIDHANEIKNTKNGADIKFMQGYQDLQNLVGESKTEEEKKKPIVEMMLDPAKRDRLNNDDVINSIHSHDQPLYVPDANGNLVRNPNRKSIDYTDVSFNPKPFEDDKYFKGLEDVKRSDLTPTVTRDRKSMTQTVTTNSAFDQDAKNTIATRAVSRYMNDPSFKDYVSKLNPDNYNDTFKQNFGRDISNPADLAAAYTLKGMQQKVTTSKLEPDVFGREQSMAALNHSYRLGEKEFAHSLAKADKKTADLWLDNHIDGLVTEAKNKTPRLYPGGTDREYDLNVDPVMSKALSVDNQSPDIVTVLPNGSFRLIFNKYDKNGKTDDVDKDRTRVISRDQMKFILGKQLGTKQLNSEMSDDDESNDTPKETLKW